MPPWVLAILLWPVSAVRRPQVERRRIEQWFRAHSGILKAPRPEEISRAQTQSVYGRLLPLWADRLALPRWQARCRIEGIEELRAAESAGKPVVIASLHFGPYEVLNYCLRGHGITSAMLIWEGRRERSVYRNYRYRLVPSRDVPFVFGLSELLAMRRFLIPGRALIVMMDANRGRQINLPFGTHTFRMATGGIRLAASAGARLIPCLVTAGRGAWEYRIRFYPAVPEEMLGQSPDEEGAGKYLLDVFKTEMERSPQACSPALLDCVLEGSATPSLVPR